MNLPRKFKIAVEGCAADCAQGPINDIGLYAKLQGDQRGFSVFAGGGLGAQPFLAKPVREFIPAEDLLIWCEAIVRIQHRYGERKNRMRARMKYLSRRWARQVPRRDRSRVERVAASAVRDAEEVREQVAASRTLRRGAGRVRQTLPGRAPDEHWRRTNTHAQKQPGHTRGRPRHCPSAT